MHSWCVFVGLGIFGKVSFTLMLNVLYVKNIYDSLLFNRISYHYSCRYRQSEPGKKKLG